MRMKLSTISATASNFQCFLFLSGFSLLFSAVLTFSEATSLETRTLVSLVSSDFYFSNRNKDNFIAEGIIFLFPTAFSIMTLGCSHYSTEKTVGSIVLNIARSQTPEDWKEDILSFMIRRDYQVTCFKFLQFGFGYYSKVSGFISCRLI